MGQMSDRLIKGEDCQHCGTYMGKGVGYPRSCRKCLAEGNSFAVRAPGADQPGDDDGS